MFAFSGSLLAQFCDMLLHVMYLGNRVLFFFFFELLGKLANIQCHVSMHEQSGKIFLKKTSSFLICQNREKGIFVHQVSIS